MAPRPALRYRALTIGVQGRQRRHPSESTNEIMIRPSLRMASIMRAGGCSHVSSAMETSGWRSGGVSGVGAASAGRTNTIASAIRPAKTVTVQMVQRHTVITNIPACGHSRHFLRRVRPRPDQRGSRPPSRPGSGCSPETPRNSSQAAIGIPRERRAPTQRS